MYRQFCDNYISIESNKSKRKKKETETKKKHVNIPQK